MKKISVTSQQFNTETFERMGDSRTEIIDVTTNVLFQNCKNILDIRKQYESFWNDIGQYKNTPIKVLVKSVELIEK
jgi:hypothetical protein